MFKITEIFILTHKNRADKIFLHTDLPSPYTYTDTAPVSLGFETTKGYGQEYVEKHFPGIPIQIVNAE